MREQRSRRDLLKATGALGVAGLAGCVGGESTGGGTTTGTTASDGANATEASGTPTPTSDSMTVFHAGSLAPPFGAAEPKFEDEYGVTVNREAKGSVASTKKITTQGRSADVLGVSDFRLIRDRVLPEYGSWYAIFAANAMSLQYREDSPGAGEIGPDNWWEVLSRDGVKVGHSDPAIDPGGYRAVMAMQLGKEKLDGTRLYGQQTFEKIRDNMTVPTGTETKLEGQLESGKLDYALYYRSIASQSGMPYVDLQPHVDLSKLTTKYANHYAKAEVETSAGTFTGAPIAYGITVPSVAEAPVLGAMWVEYMTTEPGRKILKETGLIPKEPAVVTKDGDVPARVARRAEAKTSVGPLEL
ncbi:extracellular solute-binding protein [Halorussus gelatinilyticus]|uniref:Extracellular solute-binding protein n=1 Tax=Halorussus gelatinilyticus TaxID=2937524 RepID=A0A8U0ILI0_9EURY|nr:extracellular solute-binding protein [Halorussus gelatinilyticus]UPW01461.1 extracellular solute-binding protein [Halorussus gelatinilyticus]